MALDEPDVSRPPGIEPLVAPEADGSPALPARRIDALLDELARTRDADMARRIEQRILRAWHRSGSDTVDLLTRRAAIAISDRQYALALDYLDTVVELKPDFAEGWNKRATVYYMIDEYQRAMADIGRVLALEPRHFGALGGLGMIFRELNDNRRALSVFRRTLEIHPHFGDVRRNVERLAIEVEGRGI